VILPLFTEVPGNLYHRNFRELFSCCLQ